MKSKSLQITERWSIEFKPKIAIIKGKLEPSIHVLDLYVKILWYKLSMGKHNYHNLER